MFRYSCTCSVLCLFTYDICCTCVCMLHQCIYVLHSSLIGLVLSLLYTKSGHSSGLSICCSLNAVASVLHDYISKADIPRTPGKVLDVYYVYVFVLHHYCRGILHIILYNRTHTRLHSCCV